MSKPFATFALDVWLFERTGSVTQFALVGLFSLLPRIVLSPLAGSIVDRWDRRRIMIVSDASAGSCTFALVLLLAAGRLEVWHVYLTSGISAAFGALQWPAYAAATTLLVAKEHLGRADGMVQFGQSVSTVINFLWGMAGALAVPLVLGFTSSDRLGFIISIARTGMLAGSLAMGIWGGPRRRIDGVLGFEFISGLCFMPGGRPSPACAPGRSGVCCIDTCPAAPG